MYPIILIFATYVKRSKNKITRFISKGQLGLITNSWKLESNQFLLNKKTIGSICSSTHSQFILYLSARPQVMASKTILCLIALIFFAQRCEAQSGTRKSFLHIKKFFFNFTCKIDFSNNRYKVWKCFKCS